MTAHVRTARRPRAAATVLVTATVAATVLAGCAGNGDSKASDPTPVEASGSPSDASPTAASTSAVTSSTSGATSPSSTPPSSATVPVYFVGDTPNGPRLYREFQRVSGADPLTAAVTLSVAGDALDPDYRTGYPAGLFQSVRFDAGGFTVELTDPAWTQPGGLSPRQARLAVQQLVYTLQGVQQQRAPLTVVLDGTPTSLFGIDTSQGINAAKPLQVLAFVNVTAPEQDTTVTGTFRASGLASSFEGNVPWELRAPNDAVVKSGHATAGGYLGKLYPWQATVDLTGVAPGTYEFVAMTDDPSGGEGRGPTEDSKTITVQ